MLKQWPTVDITCSNRGQFHAHVDMVKSHFIQLARDKIAEHYDLHRCESAAEFLDFINSLLAYNKYLFHVAECVEDDERHPNPTQRNLKAAKRMASIYYTSWRKQSHLLSTSYFMIGRIAAVGMLMDHLIS
jgi:hypothetical protein